MKALLLQSIKNTANGYLSKQPLCKMSLTYFAEKRSNFEKSFFKGTPALRPGFHRGGSRDLDPPSLKLNGQLSAIPVLLGLGQASYLVSRGKELAARYRSGESLSFMGEFFNYFSRRVGVRSQISKWIHNGESRRRDEVLGLYSS